MRILGSGIRFGAWSLDEGIQGLVRCRQQSLRKQMCGRNEKRVSAFGGGGCANPSVPLAPTVALVSTVPVVPHVPLALYTCSTHYPFVYSASGERRDWREWREWHDDE